MVNDDLALELALKSTQKWLEELNTSPVCATETLENLRAKIAIELKQEGVEPERVISELVEATKGGLLGSAGGRFYAWVIGGSLRSALAADWLTSAWNPEWSRRARSISIYAALREIGKKGVEELVERCCQYCQMLVAEVGKLPGVEILWKPQLNQGLIRFKSSKKSATNADHDFETDQVIAAINATGEAFFSGTTWRGVRAMRVSVVNWRTSEDDVLRTIAAVKKIVLGRR